MTVTELDKAQAQDYTAQEARLRRELAGGAPIVTPPPDACEHTARQFEGGQSEDDYSNDTAPNLAWDAMLRLVERLYPDYKD